MTVDLDSKRRLGMTDAQAERCVMGSGCRACGDTGYTGRVGLYEMMPISKGVRAELMAGAGEQAMMAAAAPEGFGPLLQLGVEAAVAEHTTPAELLRTLTIDSVAMQAV